MGKYQKGNKFVIEIESDNTPWIKSYYIKGITSFAIRESDLDKLTSIDDYIMDSGKFYTEHDPEAAYKCGMCDAWEVARKIMLNPNKGGFTGKELQEIFGFNNSHTILSNLSVAEVLEKISDYNKKKEKMFCAGDVIQNKENPEIIAVVTFADFDGHFDAIKLSESDKYGEKYGVYYKRDMSFWEKTGKRFDLDELFQVNQKAGRR